MATTLRERCNYIDTCIETSGMPDICFHFSSETADAAGHCPGGDRTRITMPIEPALQIPNTAKPTCYLHNLAFTNNIANVYASDQSNKIVLQTGSSALKFHAGSTSKPWIGVKYQAKVDGTLQDFAVVAPMTSITDAGLTGPTYDAQGDWAWGTSIDGSDQPDTLNGKTLAQIYAQINTVFEKALAGTAFAAAGVIHKSFQDKVKVDGGARVPTAAFTVNGAAKVFAIGISGSSANGLVKYSSVSVSGNQATADVTLVNPAAAPQLTAQNFQFMSSAELNAYINDVIVGPNALASYTAAKSIFDALGGGQVNGAYSLGGTFAVYDDTALATTFGFFPDDQVSATITLDVDAYQIADFERAITVAAQANTAFWAKANAHLPVTKPVTKLVDPSAVEGVYKEQTTSAEDGKPAPDGFQYVKLLSLTPDVGADRVIMQLAPNIEVGEGALVTNVWGFDASQLGLPSEGPKLLKAQNAAKIDRTRAILFHCPTIAAGSYSTAGKRGGSAIGMVPIDTGVGDTQSWECSVPVMVPARIAGTSMSSITVFLSNEDGDKLQLQGDRWSAQLILSF